MKKFIFVFLAFIAIDSQARIIGTNPTGANADIVCFGGRIAGNTVVNKTEDCIDSNGNIITTTPSNQSLGSQQFPFASAYLGSTVFESAVGATVPFISGISCGGGVGANAASITGTDFAGSVTLGTGSNTQCLIGFNPVFVNTPICSIDLLTSSGIGTNAATNLNAVILPTSIQLNTGLGAPGIIDFICVGNQK